MAESVSRDQVYEQVNPPPGYPPERIRVGSTHPLGHHVRVHGLGFSQRVVPIASLLDPTRWRLVDDGTAGDG